MKKAPHEVDAIVGKNIRAIRQGRQMSQTELGQKIGVTFQQVQKYERGSNRVSASKLVEIAATLACPLATLFAGVEDRAANTDPVPMMTSEAIRIARLFDELSGKPRAAIRKLLETLIEEETAAIFAEAA